MGRKLPDGQEGLLPRVPPPRRGDAARRRRERRPRQPIFALRRLRHARRGARAYHRRHPHRHPEYVAAAVTEIVRTNTLAKIERLQILVNRRQIRYLLLKFCCVTTITHLARSVSPCIFASHIARVAPIEFASTGHQ